MGENLGNVNPEPEIAENTNIQNEWNSNDWGQNYRNRWHVNNYWAGSQGWMEPNPGPTAKGKGSFVKGESQNPGVERRGLIMDVKSIKISTGI